MERRVICRLTVISVMAFAVLAWGAPAWAAEGDLDTSFSGDGKTTTPVGVGGFLEAARDVALQPDGKIVAGGRAIGIGTGADFALARYDADGELDPSFGTGGRMLTHMGAQGRDEEVQAVVVQSDGKIVAAGFTGRLSNPPDFTDFAVARYNPNGTLDTSFSGDGKFTLDFGGTEEFATDLAVQPDGKIVVSGTVDGSSAARDFALIRLNPGGTLDTTFDTDGIVRTDIASSSDDARAVAVQPNGKIVAGGSAGTNFALARYNANGSLDTTFDTDGKVFTNVVTSGDEQILDLAFAADNQPDKKIVVAGDMANNFAVARYNANGSLDTNTDADPSTHFDTDGVQTTDFGSVDEAFGLVVAGDNKVTAAGHTSANDTTDFALARYNATGSLDTQFSNDGKKTTDFGDTGDEAAGIALQADGKVVAAGASGERSSSGGRFALARYSVSGNLDSTFSLNGRVASVVTTGGDDVAEAVALQPDGKTVAAGRSPGASSQSATSVVRYNKNGTLDTSFGGDGRVLTELEVGTAGEAVAVQPDGKILVAAFVKSSTPRFGLFRYNRNGTLDTSFSSDGIQTTGFGDNVSSPQAIALQPNGKVLVAGIVFIEGAQDFAVVRYNANGSLDTTFDTDGRVTTPVGQGQDRATAITLQGDKIVLAGTASESGEVLSQDDFAVARFNTNGSLDDTFGGDGRVTTPVSSPGLPEDVQAVLAQPDGKIVAGGQAFPGTCCSSGFALVRYDENGSLDPTFSGDGILIDTGAKSTVQGLGLQQGGRIVAAGGGLDFTLARYRPNGARDTTFSSDGVQTTDFGSFEEARAVVVGPDSKITAAGATRNGDFNDDFAVARYIGDATPPSVKNVVPTENATGVAPGANVSVFFSEQMTPASISASTVGLFEAGSTTPIAATVSYDAATGRATLNPNASLQPGVRYKAVVTPAAKDLAGNGLDQAPALDGNQSKTWFFTVKG